MATTYGTYIFTSQNDTDCQAFTFTSTDGQTTTGVIDAAGVAAKFCHDTNGGNSAGVGPSEGQGGSGGYLYTECSSPGVNGDLYTMVFDTILDASVEQWQFNFYSMQCGPAIGDNESTFEVQINENNGGWVTVGSQMGGTGNDTTDQTLWVSQSVDLSASGVNIDSNTQVRILITTQGPNSAWHGDIGIDTVEIVGTDLGGNYDQTSFRLRNDDGSETTATWKAVVNTNTNQIQDENFRIRFLIQENDDVVENDVAFQLQYNLNSGGWNDVNGSSNVVRSFNSTNITDGGNTTQQLGTGTYISINAGLDESNGIVGGTSLDFTTTINQEVEVEFSLQIRSADTSRSDTIQLRIIKNGVVITTYTNTPTITIPTGAGMQLASAEKLLGSSGVENAGVFNFERSLPWGAINIALRKISGTQSVVNLSDGDKFNTIKTPLLIITNNSTIDGTTVDGDVSLDTKVDLTNVVITGDLDITTAATYSFSNVIVGGDTTNSDSGGNVVILASDGSDLTTTEPGTGNDQVNIQFVSEITLTGLVDDTEVRVFKSGTSEEVAGIEIAIDGSIDNRSFSFTYIQFELVDIIIHNIDYIYERLDEFQIPDRDSELPIQQELDRNYLEII